LRFLRLPLPAGHRRQPHHFSPAILLRLALATVIEAPIFVYVDADVLFTGDPAALDRIDLQASTLAAAAWPQPRDLRASGHGVLPRYFASSLLVIDRARFLAEGTGERCLELIARHRFDFPDQDALNLCCGAWQALPEGLCREVPDQGAALSQDPVGPLLLQFSGSEKPWHPFSRHPCRRLFRRHLSRTPYRFFPPGLGDLRWRSLGSRLRQRLLGSVRSCSRSTSA
jgi:lipopolysaccharide biosynthesis glycosyltransferase